MQCILIKIYLIVNTLGELYLNVSLTFKLFNEIFYSNILIMTCLGTRFLHTSLSNKGSRKEN